jgi:hypothetical protein
MKLAIEVEKMPETRAFLEHDNKLTMMKNRIDAKIVKETSTVTKAPLSMLDENLATLHYSLMFDSSDALQMSLPKKLDEMISTGWIQKINENRSIAGAQKIEDELQEARPLTLDHLGVCFIAILICLGFSLAVFLIEKIIGSL